MVKHCKCVDKLELDEVSSTVVGPLTMTDEGVITIPAGSEKGTVTFKVKISIKDSTTHQYSNTMSIIVGCTSSGDSTNEWVWASDMTLQ